MLINLCKTNNKRRSGLASRSLHKTFSSDVGYVRYARGFPCLNHINEDGENSQQTHYFHYDRNLIMVIIDIENLHLLSFNFIEEVYAMNLDAVNPELESKINDLVCEAYNKSFLEQEKLLKEAFELIPKPVTQWAHPTTMVAIALFDFYYKNQKYEQAEEWLTIALSVADLGTTNAGTYLLGGLFYYDIEKYDDAYKYFDIAYNDAGYYPFSIEDKKYWQFYKQRKEELNPKKKTKK